MTLRSRMGRAPASSSTLRSWVRLLQCSSSASCLAGGGLNPGASYLSARINVKSSLGFLLGGTVRVCIYIFTYIWFISGPAMGFSGRCHRLVLPWDSLSCGSSLLGWDDAQSLSLLPHKRRGPWHLSRHPIFRVYSICVSHVFSPSSVWSQSEACRDFCCISQLAYAAPMAC